MHSPTASARRSTRVVADAAEPGSGGLTPSDLAAVELDQAAIEQVEAALDHPVDDVWPLSPLQEGLYFHATFDAGAVDVYTVTDHFDLARPVDVDRLRVAFAGLLADNPTTRAAFLGDGLPRPVSAIVSLGPDDVPVDVIDIADVAPDDQPARLDELLAVERTRRFDVRRAPLLHVTVVRRGPDRCRIMVSRHLLLWDGWSGQLVFGELFRRYEEAGVGAAAGETAAEVDLAGERGSFRDYLAWLARQDDDASLAAWRDALVGVEEPTLVAPAGAPAEPVLPHFARTELSDELSDRVRALARREGLTLSSVLSGAWGVVLSGLVGRDDVVFGLTVSGRPAEVPDVEGIVGLFLNTVPARVTVDPAEPAVALLRRTQAARVDVLPHEHVSLGLIQRAAGVGQLFDTLYVLQNFDGAGDLGSASLGQFLADHDVEGFGTTDATHYAITLVVRPGPQLGVLVAYRPDLLDADLVDAVLARYVRALTDQLRTPYLLVCSGARSDELRALLGVTFDGHSFDDRFLICDIRADMPGWAHERRFYFDPAWNPGRQVLIHPCPDSTFRIDWQVPPEFDLDAEFASGGLDARIRGDGRRGVDFEIVWMSVYRFHSRCVDRMRRGPGPAGRRRGAPVLPVRRARAQLRCGRRRERHMEDRFLRWPRLVTGCALLRDLPRPSATRPRGRTSASPPRPWTSWCPPTRRGPARARRCWPPRPTTRRCARRSTPGGCRSRSGTPTRS